MEEDYSHIIGLEEKINYIITTERKSKREDTLIFKTAHLLTETIFNNHKDLKISDKGIERELYKVKRNNLLVEHWLLYAQSNLPKSIIINTTDTIDIVFRNHYFLPLYHQPKAYQ